MTLVIQSGIKGEMPSFSKKYDAQDTAAIVAYLKSVNKSGVKAARDPSVKGAYKRFWCKCYETAPRE
jgi:mono/diheme cytochrome c family protein